ncbi:MAG: FlgD immunoglobulin-like domain containing protein [Candidatus Eisenbacteria bacterium]
MNPVVTKSFRVRPSRLELVRTLVVLMIGAIVTVPSAGGECIDWAGHLQPLGAVDLSSAREVAVAGDYAYVTGSRLQVVDISNQDAPVVVVSDAGVGVTKGIASAAGYLYVASDLLGFAVLSIANPAAPVVVGSFDPPSYGWGVSASGNFVYMSTSSSLQVIDVSNPAAPHLEGAVYIPGIVRGVVKWGSYVYAATNGGVQAISVSNPAAPHLEGSCPTTGEGFALCASGDRLWVSTSQTIDEISIASPAAPSMLGSYSPGCRTLGIASVEGQVWFVGGTLDGELGLDFGVLQVLDTTTPGSMRLQASIGLPHECIGLALRQPIAIVCSSTSPGLLHVIDGTNPTTPPVLGSAPWYQEHEVVVEGALAYTGAPDPALEIFSIADPSAPQLVGYRPLEREISGLALYHAGGETYACAAERYAGVQIVRVTNPSSPQTVGAVDTPGSPREIVVDGSYAYVADGSGGLQIVDLTNPAAPQIVGHYSVPDRAYDVVVQGSYAYIADITAGLLVVDVSDPSSPSLVGSLDPPGDFLGIDIDGSVVYLTSEMVGVHLIDVTNPAAPQLITTLPTMDHGVETRVHAGCAYFVSTEIGLQVFDVGNPWSPVELGRLWMRGAEAIAPGNDVVCVAGANLQLVPAQCASADVSESLPGGFVTSLVVAPNPTSGGATIHWEPRQGGTDAARSLEIYDTAGRVVRRLLMSGAASSVTWDGRDAQGRRLPRGIYLVRGQAGDETWRGRIVLAD